MSETYEDIVQKIKDANGNSCYWFDYSGKTCGGCPAQHTDCSETVNLDIAERVKNAVAADMSKWFIRDMNGKKLRIGDETNEGNISHIGDLEGAPSIVSYDPTRCRKLVLFGTSVWKIEPDSWDEYRRDLMLTDEEYAAKHDVKRILFTTIGETIALHRTNRAKKLAEVPHSGH